VRGDEYDAHRWQVSHDVASGVESTHHRHIDIQHHDIRLEASRFLNCCFAVRRLPYYLALIREQHYQRLQHDRMIVGNQDSRAHDGFSG